MGSQAAEGVVGEAVPLDGRIEDVVRDRIAGAEVHLAPQGVVGRGDEARAPLGARIEAGLADGIDDRGALAQDDGVVAVEPAGAVGLIGLRQDGRIGCGLGEDEHVAVGHHAGQVDGQTGGAVAVEEHLDVVAGHAEVDGGAGAVVDLQRLVVRAALDVLGEEEIGRVGGDRGGQGQETQEHPG
jgi:hypothetical protein